MTIHATLPLSSFKQNTLVILLGTAPAPRGQEGASRTGALHVFSFSIRKLQAYFSELYQLDEKYLLNLLETDMHPQRVEQEIIHFLLMRSKLDTIQRIVLYYAGYYVEYGADLALQLQAAQGADEPPQTLRLATLARILATNMRTVVQRVIIFDGYLVNAHANMSQVAGEAIERAFVLPPDDEQVTTHGATSVLYACQPVSFLLSAPTQPTVFSEGLLSVLEHGTAQNGGGSLSMRSVYHLMHIFLNHHFSHAPVHPLLLASVAPENGQSCLDLPIFPDPGKSSGEATSLLQQASEQLRSISQRLRDNLSGQETHVRYLTAANIGSLKELVTIPVQSVEAPKAPLIQRGKLYLAQPRVRSIDLVTGASMNYTEQPQLLDPLLLAHDDFLYVRTDERTLSCFASDARPQRWTSQGSRATRLQDAPLVVDGIVFVLFTAVSESQSQEHRVRAIDALTGRIIWEIVFQQGAPHSPVLLATRLFLRTRDNHIYAIDTAQLPKSWSFGSPNGSITFDPVVSRGLVYLIVDRYGRGGSVLYVLDLSTGDTRWSSEIDTHALSIEYAPLVHNEIVYLVSRRRMNPLQPSAQESDHYVLHAFHAVTGEELWDYPTNEGGQEMRILSQPLVLGAQVWLLLWDSVQKVCVLHCISASTAQLSQRLPLLTKRTLFAHPHKGNLRFPPLVAGSLLLIPCTLVHEQNQDEQRSCIFVLDMQAQTVRHEIVLPGIIAIAPLIVHGLLYLLVQGTGTRSSGRTRLLVIDLATGHLCWEYAQADVLACPPVITRDRLCFVTSVDSAQNSARYAIRVFRPTRS